MPMLHLETWALNFWGVSTSRFKLCSFPLQCTVAIWPNTCVKSLIEESGGSSVWLFVQARWRLASWTTRNQIREMTAAAHANPQGHNWMFLSESFSALLSNFHPFQEKVRVFVCFTCRPVFVIAIFSMELGAHRPHCHQRFGTATLKAVRSPSIQVKVTAQMKTYGRFCSLKLIHFVVVVVARLKSETCLFFYSAEWPTSMCGRLRWCKTGNWHLALFQFSCVSGSVIRIQKSVFGSVPASMAIVRFKIPHPVHVVSVTCGISNPKCLLQACIMPMGDFNCCSQRSTSLAGIMKRKFVRVS